MPVSPIPRQRPAVAAMLGAALVLLCVYLAHLAAIHRGYSETDYNKFYASAQFALEGGSIYHPATAARFVPNGPAEEGEILGPNLNPPFQTLLFLPLARLALPDFFLAWSLLSLALGVAGALLLARTAVPPGPERRAAEAGALLLLLCSYPTWLGVELGQLSLLLLALLAAAWAAQRAGREGLAGTILGVALSIKLFAGLFLLMLLVQRRWRALLCALAGLLACNALAAAVLGASDYARYVEVLGAVTWLDRSWNASVTGFLERIIGATAEAPLVRAPGLCRAAVAAASLGLLASWIWLAWRRPDRDLLFAATVPLMLLLSPLGWAYYFPVLLVAFAAIGDHLLRQGRPSPWAWRLLALAWMAAAIRLPKEALHPLWGWFVGPALPCYALLLLYGVIVATAARGLRADAGAVRSRSPMLPSRPAAALRP